MPAFDRTANLILESSKVYMKMIELWLVMHKNTYLIGWDAIYLSYTI
jgi:hypothetical protein